MQDMRWNNGIGTYCYTKPLHVPPCHWQQVILFHWHLYSTFPPLTQWEWKTFGRLGKPAQQLLRDLNIDFRDPWNKREYLIVDLLNDINLVHRPRKFILQ